MKRQRRVDSGGAAVDQAPSFEGSKTTSTMKITTKRAKKATEKAGKEEGKMEGGDHQLGLSAVENMTVGDYENSYWGCFSGGAVVDEQMSWGSIWLPLWDVEFMGEAHYGLFSDVIWDDDIWGLRTTQHVPNP